MESYIKGTFRKTIFENGKGFIIGICKVKETSIEELQIYVGKTLTFTGTFAELTEDEMYLFRGEPVEHPKYGFQFQVTSYERLKPSDKEGIVAFLCSDLFYGIGEKMAISIVDRLGENSLEQILENPSCLELVPKLSYKKAKNIYDTLVKYEESHTTIVYLTELGFTMKDALLIYNTYHAQTIPTIENNIYKLLDDINEIKFLKLDAIAQKIGIDSGNEERLKSCIVYVMEHLCYTNGDTYLEDTQIKQELASYLKFELSEDMWDTYIDNLRWNGKIVVEENRYYLKYLYEAEMSVANKILYLVNKDIKKIPKIDKYIEKEEINSAITYEQKQRAAIKIALENNIAIITGGPGTGKTTLIKAIVNIYMEMNSISLTDVENRIALLAPTGRASKRMSESTLLPASTIHRFLRWNKENNEFGINEYNKSPVDLVIIDEASMLDIELMNHLFKGLTNNCQIIIVGDENQLASVGPGQILKDCIDSGIIPIIKLDVLYRQEEGSYITTLAYEIQNEELSSDFKETKSDYTFLNCSKEVLNEAMASLARQIVNKGYDYKQVQFMAPMYAGVNGIDNMNQILQEIWNPKDDAKREINLGDVVFRENDKVLELVNVPDENIYNGDIGVIERIVPASISKSKKAEMYIDFDGNLVKFESKDFYKLKHGYMISIHKSQGSEFEIVILPVCSSYYRMLYKKLFYTAVTRAKRKLIIIGEEQAFRYAVQNTKEYIRKTSLALKLKINV